MITEVSRPGDEIRETVQSDYAVLKRRIQEAGLLEKRPGFYAFSITTNLVVFFGGAVYFYVAYLIRKAQGVDLNLAFREIPVE